MSRYSGKRCRLLVMFSLTSAFFLVELIVGYVTNSMALVADSFHMLSDIAALAIAYVSVRMAPKSWSKNTFGWARAEVLGALVNAVFLVALCFSITVESLKRFYEPEDIEDPNLILVVGIIGLLVNLIGLCLFREHGHSHGGHTHHSRGKSNSLTISDSKDLSLDYENTKRGSQASARHHIELGHGALSHLSELVEAECGASVDDVDCQSVCPDDDPRTIASKNVEVDADRADVDSKHVIDKMGNKVDHVSSSEEKSCVVSIVNNSSKIISQSGADAPKKKRGRSSHHMNMRGVFLHVMADALGSVIVIISALAMSFCKAPECFPYIKYVDPGLSLILVAIMMRGVWPLLIESALILLQTVPTHIEMDSLKRKLLQEVDGILAVHEFHVWQLTGDRIVASAHIRCLNLSQYMKVAEKIKEFFHHEGIHSTTIQPEFVDCKYYTSQSLDEDGVSGAHEIDNRDTALRELRQQHQFETDNDCMLNCPTSKNDSEASNCDASKCCKPTSRLTTTMATTVASKIANERRDQEKTPSVVKSLNIDEQNDDAEK